MGDETANQTLRDDTETSGSFWEAEKRGQRKDSNPTGFGLTGWNSHPNRVSEKITECLDLYLILKVCHKYALWKINKRWTQIDFYFILSPKRAYFTAICRWGLSPNYSHKFYWLSETTVTTHKLVMFQVSAGSEGKILRFSRLFFCPSCSLSSVYSGTKMDYFHSPFHSSGPFSFAF